MTQADDTLPWQEQLSGWMDGDVTFDTALDTAQTQQLWQHWHVIGDVLRSDDLAIVPSAAFHTRLSAALAQEAPLQAKPTHAFTWQQIWQPIWQKTWQKIRQQQRMAPGRLFRATNLSWRWSGALALAAALVVWLLAPISSQRNDAGTMLASNAAPAGELAGNPYVQTHRQFAGNHPAVRVALDGGD